MFEYGIKVIRKQLTGLSATEHGGKGQWREYMYSHMVLVLQDLLLQKVN